jgi:hypothetical protein
VQPGAPPSRHRQSAPLAQVHNSTSTHNLASLPELNDVDDLFAGTDREGERADDLWPGSVTDGPDG